MTLIGIGLFLVISIIFFFLFSLTPKEKQADETLRCIYNYGCVHPNTVTFYCNCIKCLRCESVNFRALKSFVALRVSRSFLGVSSKTLIGPLHVKALQKVCNRSDTVCLRVWTNKTCNYMVSTHVNKVKVYGWTTGIFNFNCNSSSIWVLEYRL